MLHRKLKSTNTRFETKLPMHLFDSANRCIGRRPSQRQKLALLDWLEKNIDIASDKFSDGDGVCIREREVVWEEIASYLNCLGEAKKNGFKWRKFWMDLR